MSKRRKPEESAFITVVSNLLLTIKTIIISPRTFFDQMSDEGGWLEPFLFFCFCAVVNSFMNMLMGFSFIRLIANSIPPDLPLPAEIHSPLFFFICFLSYLLMMIAGSFITSFAITFVLHLLGGEGKFQSTYRVLACCWVVLLVTWIPFIGTLLGMYFFVLAWFGLSAVHKVPGWKSLLGVLGGSLGITLFSFVCCLIVSGAAATYMHGHQTANDVLENAPHELTDPYLKHEGESNRTP